MNKPQDPNRVLIFDTTLRDGEQSPGISLNTHEKLEIAQQLARLGVDVIEAGFPITSPGDFEAVQEISRKVEGPVVAGLARTHVADIDAAFETISKGGPQGLLVLQYHQFVFETKRIVEREGRRAITIAGDIGEKDFCEQAVRQTVDQLGRLDILVNNAGEQHWDKDVTDIDEQQLRRTFQTNIFGMFFMTQAARPHLKQGSAIINTTSETTYEGSKLLLDYSATKGAIVGFTRSLAKNLVKEGIRVNAVAPGPIWTPLNPSGGQPKEKIPEFGKDSPMGRPGQPNEVAPSFLFLACEDASYMTGQVLHPDGGNTTSS